LFDFGDSGAQRQNIEYLALVDIADQTQPIIARGQAGFALVLASADIIAFSLFFRRAEAVARKPSLLKFNSLNGKRRLEPDQSASTRSDR
jgi:hypothetical protein